MSGLRRTTGKIDSTFRMLSSREYTGTCYPSMGDESDSTFRMLPMGQNTGDGQYVSYAFGRSSESVSAFDRLTRLQDEIRIEVELVFVMLPTTQPIVLVVAGEESEHMQV